MTNKQITAKLLEISDLAQDIMLAITVHTASELLEPVKTNSSVSNKFDLDEEAVSYGELAKLMTLMDICKQDEAYEKCAIIKQDIDKAQNIIKKYNK
tara:strand:+ start:1383 stop:1673 length:291 start_codon:yes stop_codon:yes gene_type:complete